MQNRISYRQLLRNYNKLYEASSKMVKDLEMWIEGFSEAGAIIMKLDPENDFLKGLSESTLEKITEKFKNSEKGESNGELPTDTVS